MTALATSEWILVGAAALTGIAGLIYCGSLILDRVARDMAHKHGHQGCCGDMAAKVDRALHNAFVQQDPKKED